MDLRVLEKLSNAHGVSGDESAIRKILMKELKPYCDKFVVDKVGNLIAIKKGKKPAIMIAAHMDEIGFMVKDIERDGLLRISPVGGVDPLSLIADNVLVLAKKPIPGVITTRDFSDYVTIEKIPEMDQMVVDTGMSKKELIKAGVAPGNYVSFDQKFRILHNKKTVVGKAMDDRAGCFMVCEIAKKIGDVKNEINYVFTIQEEVGLYGSKVSAYNLAPDWSIVIDVTETNEFGDERIKTLGSGPGITLKDADVITSKPLNDHIEKVAKKLKIPLQLDVSDEGTTDALSISFSKEGVPSSVISVPIRNLHSSISIAHLNDLERAIKLMIAVVKNPPKGFK